MPDFAPSVTRLIDELKRLPGIGQKTAQRLAFYLLRVDPEQAFALSDAIRDAKEKVRECSICNNITDADPCLFCTGPSRSKKIICVVEEATNIQAVEKTRGFDGLYHVLGGALSPLQGIGPDQLKIKSLIERLKGGTVEEIIVATSPTAEGEATAVYLSKLIKPLGGACDADCDGDSGGLGSGICGRSDDEQSDGGAAGFVGEFANPATRVWRSPRAPSVACSAGWGYIGVVGLGGGRCRF